MSDDDALLAQVPHGPRFALAADDVPQPFEGSVQDLNWLARPFVAHVGLAHLDVFIEVYDDDARVSGFGEDRGVERAMRPDSETRVWFTGVHAGLAVFACVDGEISLARACADLSRAAAHLSLMERGLVPREARADRALLEAVAARLGFG